MPLIQHSPSAFSLVSLQISGYICVLSCAITSLPIQTLHRLFFVCKKLCCADIVILCLLDTSNQQFPSKRKLVQKQIAATQFNSNYYFLKSMTRHCQLWFTELACLVVQRNARKQQMLAYVQQIKVWGIVLKCISVISLFSLMSHIRLCL